MWTPAPVSQANVRYRPHGPFQSGTGYQPVASLWEKARDFRRADSSRASPLGLLHPPTPPCPGPVPPWLLLRPPPPVRLPGCWQPIPRTELRTTPFLFLTGHQPKLLGSPVPSHRCPALEGRGPESPLREPDAGTQGGLCGHRLISCSLLRLGIQAPPYLYFQDPSSPAG